MGKEKRIPTVPTKVSDSVTRHDLKTDFDFDNNFEQPKWFDNDNVDYDNSAFQDTIEFKSENANVVKAKKETKKVTKKPTAEEINKDRIKMTKKFQVNYTHMKKLNDRTNKHSDLENTLFGMEITNKRK